MIELIIQAIAYIFAIIGMSLVTLITLEYIYGKIENRRYKYRDKKEYINKRYEELDKIFSNNLKIKNKFMRALTLISFMGEDTEYYKLKTKDKYEFIEKAYKKMIKYLDKDELIIEEL